MKPYVIERIEQLRRERAWQPVPLRIQPPPPEWEREQERRERARLEEESASDRGVFVIDL